MFIPWNHESVRLTGRWSRLSKDQSDPHIFVHASAASAVTTAPGSYFELAFRGKSAVLRFDMGYLGYPSPHLYIQVDGGAMTEAPVDRLIRISAAGDGNHVVKVVYKGSSEVLPRWYPSLMGMISFRGFQADAPGTLEKDERRVVEFIGDSITEGVLVDADYIGAPANSIDQFNRVYQDDVTATYAWLSAEKLNLRPVFQAYGAVGLTRSGNASVPRAGLIYPWVYDGVPYTGEKPDYVVINHGANDRGTGAEEYILRYRELVSLVHEINPGAQVICLGAFCGAFDTELRAMVQALDFNWLHFISTKGWLPPEPLHPLRDGHIIAAERLCAELKTLFGL